MDNLDTPLLMDSLSAKYDPEALRVITQNEFLRRKIEELQDAKNKKDTTQSFLDAKNLKPSKTVEEVLRIKASEDAKQRAIDTIAEKIRVSVP